ncbi:MAG TPA: cytochrome c oxidase subunit II [Solirubrobacteraceae bacterium]|nr:cytochrome c oxidase subunit II [Solirubrobacteraceae bacterium]
MSAAAAPGGTGAGFGEPRHGARIAVAWAILTVIAVPLVIWVAGPHIPPYSGHSTQSSDQHTVNVVLLTAAVPVIALIWVYFGYAISVFRQRGPEIVDGPPLTADPRIQITWLVVTSVMVLALAVYGTIGLYNDSHGAGGGQGPNPLSTPPAGSTPLQVQVIGQQWLWTFRYPGYGGVETATLEIPANRWVAFHVTSLDVDHSFWAYELGVKADAIPGSDNVAYVKATNTGQFQVRCAELCGLWHGHMNSYGRVVNAGAFSSWIAARQQQYSAITKTLPPYSKVYYPDPIRRAG